MTSDAWSALCVFAFVGAVENLSGCSVFCNVFIATSSSSFVSAKRGGSTPSTLKRRCASLASSSSSSSAGRTAPHPPQKKRSERLVPPPHDQHAPRGSPADESENARWDTRDGPSEPSSRQTWRPPRRPLQMPQVEARGSDAAAAARCSARSTRVRGPDDLRDATRRTSRAIRRVRHIPRVH